MKTSQPPSVYSLKSYLKEYSPKSDISQTIFKKK